MEQVGSIIKAQSAGSSALARPGTQRLPRESVTHLATMLRQMSAAMPHQEYGEETTEVFLLAFEELAVEFSVKNLETALRSFLSRQKFFPHPSEVREVLEQMAKKAKQLAEQALPGIGCSACLDSDGEGLAGFVYTHRPGQPREVKPCECRLARARAKKALENRA